MGAMYFIERIDKTKGPIRSIYRRLLRFLFSREYGGGCKYSGDLVIGNIRVGHGSIVGANAVVINDVPPRVVVGGTCAYH